MVQQQEQLLSSWLPSAGALLMFVDVCTSIETLKYNIKGVWCGRLRLMLDAPNGLPSPDVLRPTC